MPTFVTLRLRLPLPAVPVAPRAPMVSFASTAPFIITAPVLLGAEGDRPPRDVDLSLTLLPLLNGKPTEQMPR